MSYTPPRDVYQAMAIQPTFMFAAALCALCSVTWSLKPACPLCSTAIFGMESYGVRQSLSVATTKVFDFVNAGEYVTSSFLPACPCGMVICFTP